MSDASITEHLQSKILLISNEVTLLRYNKKLSVTVMYYFCNTLLPTLVDMQVTICENIPQLPNANIFITIYFYFNI